MAQKRVALVLSGGVSLGSYIAGALDELLRAFEATHDDPSGDQYVIDIITGASAGATTAGIIAHGLRYRGGETLLYDTWVRQIDMLDLLRPEVPGELSLLSSDNLHAVAGQVFAWPDGQAPRRARCCAETLIVAMTLTNIDPVPYRSSRPMRSASGPVPFVQQRHAEQETFQLTDKILPTDQGYWERVAKVAIASAAIPFVFPLVKLRRDLSNPLHYPQDRKTGSGPIFAEGDAERDYLYCDGGTFNNLPLDLAWHYIRQIDGTPDDRVSANRVIVVVDPSPENMAALARRYVAAPYPNLLQFVPKLIGALWTESSAIQFDREIVGPLVGVVQQVPGQDTSIEEAIPGIDRPIAELLDHFALVTPEVQPRLAGSYLGMALSAFLDQRFREYDFRRGAADARRVADKRLGIANKTERAAQFYQPDGDKAIEVAIPEYASLAACPSARVQGKNVQEVFEDALKARLHALIHAAVGKINPPGPDVAYGASLDLLLTLTYGALRGELPKIWDSHPQAAEPRPQ